MSNFYYGGPLRPVNPQQYHNRPSGRQTGDGVRSKRGTRSQMSLQHPNMAAIRLLSEQRKRAEDERLEKARLAFEAAKGFDLEDDEMYCPFNLLTEDDLQTLYSGSDRSSLTSGSANSSPIQQNSSPLQERSQLAGPTSALPAVPSSSTPTVPLSTSPSPRIRTRKSTLTARAVAAASQPTPLHHPVAQRGRAIPIIDPATGIVVGSPPPSVSPSRRTRVPTGVFAPAAVQAWN